MDIDTAKIRELLNKRDEIDKELAECFTSTKERKPQACGICNEIGHSQRTCPKRELKAENTAKVSSPK